jgi:hypothetical protein
MLSVYIDDSGKEHDSYSLVLAGYMAPDDAWASFSQNWQRILDDANVPAFHMVDAFRMGRDYQHLGPLGRNQLVQNLLSCITQHVEHAFVLSIDMEAYRHWFARYEEPDLIPTRPYHFAFHSIQLMIADHIYQYRDDEDFRVILDVQGGESSRKLFEGVSLNQSFVSSKRPHMRLPKPTFETDHIALPLQASDMLAWLSRRENLNYRKGVDINLTVETLWLDQALSMPNKIKLMGDKELEAAANDTAKNLLAALEKPAVSTP